MNCVIGKCKKTSAGASEMCEQSLLIVEIRKCATFYVNGCKLIVRSMQVKQNFQNETSI